MHGDWIVAVATIAGALLGIVGTLIIEHFRKERKAVRFVVAAPEDLAAALRSHGSSFELKVNGVPTQTLNASSVTVQNTGNVVINELSFDVHVPGAHEIASAHPSSESLKLASALVIDNGTYTVAGHEHEPLFIVKLTYFNPGETFKITIFYDGPLTKCDIHSRLPSVKLKIVNEEDVQRRSAADENIWALFAKICAAGSVAAAAAAASPLFALLYH